MKKAETCPKCHLPLEGAGLSCAECGWTLRASRVKAEAQRQDPERFRCAWEADGLRCCYPGGAASSTNGSGPYYCAWHYHCADPVRGARLVHESQGYRPEDREAELAAAVEQSLKQRGLARREGESKAEHIKRMAQFCREGLAQFRQRSRQNTPHNEEQAP